MTIYDGLAAEIMGLADWLAKTINYEIIKEVLAGVQEVNEQVNFEIMRRFKAEQIEFAFPSQTLYVKKD